MTVLIDREGLPEEVVSEPETCVMRSRKPCENLGKVFQAEGTVSAEMLSTLLITSQGQ